MRILSSCKTTGLLASSTKFIFLAFQVSDHSHTEKKGNRKETIMNEMTRKKRVGGGRGEGGRGSKELKSGLYQRDWPLQKFKFANFLS